MGSMDISELHKRYITISNEISYAQRVRQSSAEKAAKALSAISDEDCAALISYFPELSQIRTFTAEMLLENANGEVEQVRTFYNNLTRALDSWLTKYEEGLL